MNFPPPKSKFPEGAELINGPLDGEIHKVIGKGLKVSRQPGIYEWVRINNELFGVWKYE